MSAQRTYRLESFLPWDGDYAARHLEKMARRGWRLEKVGTISGHTGGRSRRRSTTPSPTSPPRPCSTAAPPGTR